VGLPVLIKPAAGGGGIGMKAVRTERDLTELVPQARREAHAAFGDGALYVERLVERPRHVEIQIVADARHSVALFERECSLQRRHQKVVEESPSPALTSPLRSRMCGAAVAAAAAVGYRNAGTVEFLLDGTGSDARFYFLEMNTRLQVEHPVTEAVTGVDLVRAQLLVASGEPLPWTQSSLGQRGHAIECRVYAEDPARGFLPQAGSLLLYREPAGPGIRIDSGVREGSEVTVYYDPLLAKLIAWGETRDIARRRAINALREYFILGIRTNIPFLLQLLDHPAFVSGAVETTFLDREAPAICASMPMEPPPAALAAAEYHQRSRLRSPEAARAAAGQPPGTSSAPGTSPGTPAPARRAPRDPFDTLTGWRG
jgi:acetyl/propionyl-CoA carboxylase alpha subunit